MTTVSETRGQFLDFFKSHGHTPLPSSPLVPHNDPTLMFTNAGMNQFKNIFTGVEKTDILRAATAQKCVRAGGKHNDLDNVGYTARHHTFFEMMGNFSFGDYFKEEAILLAWKLLTETFELPPEKLLVTVYHDDDEAWSLWKKLTGFADEKIIRIDTSDNFWAMGDTGPCGPCSEIFYDHGDHIPGGPPGSADEDGDRFIEIWNLVFMQFDQLADGKRANLPKPSIDTGMGLERMSAILQGKHDNYDIDLFQTLIKASKDLSGNGEHLTSHRVIADHLRSSCFLIADGVMPSNEGRGYVLRRIMRRAMRHAHQLGCADPLLYRLVPTLITEMGDAYPELKRAEATITENLRSEEERFKQTLDRGLKLLDEETASLSKGDTLSGEVAFKLYDTYGFPLDLTQDLLRARHIGVDTAGFDTSMEQQRERARSAWSGSGEASVGNLWFDLKEKLGETEFTGYEKTENEATILAIVKGGEVVDSAEMGNDVYIVLDKTPFYGESGGQVGDTGNFITGGEPCAIIRDTQKPLEHFHVHEALVAKSIHVGDTVRAEIDVEARDRIRANHSATHLLHKALRDVLGEHVTQKGSRVDESLLRFDFSHGKALTAEEIEAIETKVNQVINSEHDVSTRSMSPDKAIEAGALALFGEKYGDEVRVLSMGQEEGKTFSVELCGGTHVRNTSDIELFHIASEGSVAAGIRRVVAYTGRRVRESFVEELGTLNEKREQLSSAQEFLLEELSHYDKQAEATKQTDLSFEDMSLQLENAGNETLPTLFRQAKTQWEHAIQQLEEDNKQLNKMLTQIKSAHALSSVNPEDAQVETVNGYKLVSLLLEEFPAKEMRTLIEKMLNTHDADIAALGTHTDGKGSLVVAVKKEQAASISAVPLLQAGVAAMGGKGGGGKPEMAQGGSPDGSKLEQALDAIRQQLTQKAA